MRLTQGTRLGPYEIVGPVGKRGMGEVYRARDTRLAREVAVKLLPPSLAADEQFRARFEREAKTVSALNHPHICTLYDIGRQTVDGEALDYLVLELLDGGSLADRIARGPITLGELLRWSRQIGSALDAAHRKGIVHRDLKPANVMLTSAGAKLVDFGLAKPSPTEVIAGMATQATGETLESITERGTILGTFHYMSPEQLEGGDVDARSDIFDDGHAHLRDGDAPEGVRCRDPHRPDRGDRVVAARADLECAGHDAAGPRPRGAAVLGQGPERPLAERARRGGRAAVD
jgi:serine/threonine protein kinase